MKDCSNNQNKGPHSQIEILKAAINGAETIIIGAGAGLSSSAGYEYSNDRFKNIFTTFMKNTVLRICIPADFIRTKRRKNIGLIGADIFT